VKCKYCDHVAPDLPELKYHWAARHKKAWSQHRRNMERYDYERRGDNEVQN